MPMAKTVGAFLVVLFLSGSGCFSSSTDPDEICTGFDHPLAGQWAVGAVGDTAWYTSSSGERRSFRIARIEQSTEPKINIVGESGWANCSFHRTYHYDVVETALQVTITYFHSRPNPDKQGEERFRAQIDADPSRSPYIFFVEISSPVSATREDEVIRHDDSRTIGVVTYADVFELTRVGYGLNAVSPLAEADWVRIVMARGAGLVQYELRDGRVFTRAP